MSSIDATDLVLYQLTPFTSSRWISTTESFNFPVKDAESPPDKGRGMPHGIHTVDSLGGFFEQNLKTMVKLTIK